MHLYFDAACSGKLDANNSLQLRKQQSVQIAETMQYERFGWSTSACDVNLDGFKDAIVCAPSFGGVNVSAVVGNYSGRCDLFLGPFKPYSGALEPDASIYGDRDWGLFGYTVIAADIDMDGKTDFVISAPSAGR